MNILHALPLVAALAAASLVSAAEWPRFRGPGGRGIGESAVPLEIGRAHV